MRKDQLDSLRQRIVDADVLFTQGEFEQSYRDAQQLLAEIEDTPNPTLTQWRAELLGLVGRCALHLYHTQEAVDATRDALRIIHELDNDRLSPLVEAFRENLLTALAAREDPADEDRSPWPTHRRIRSEIVRAQRLTDQHRFARSTALLEPLLNSLESLAEQAADSRGEPGDARTLYLPRILGLLGFNSYHAREIEQAKVFNERAVECCRSLGDHTGRRVYEASLAWIEHEMPEDSA